MNNKGYNFIDLFAGCGGLSEGFYRQGFNALAHVEIDPTACRTLRTRMKHYGYEDYDKAVLEIDITSDEVIKRLDDIVAERKVDIIIGGPPCQAYSSLGRARDENGMKEDPRNYLFESYVKVLNHFKPKLFVFENVTGLLTATINGEHIVDKVVAELSQEYKVVFNPEMNVLNSANYGVPQIRKRVIIIGIRKDLDITPEDAYNSIIKTHYDPEMKEDQKGSLKKYNTVRDALEELPPLKAGEGSPEVDFTYSFSNDYLRSIGDKKLSVLYDHVARNHNELDIKRYTEMAKNHWTFQELLTNREDLRHEKARVFGNSYVVQFWDLPSRTIIAHLYKDGNQFIHPDHTQGRTITVREAARLQSFPDNFRFEGPRTEQFKQIGNAVPPLFAEAIAKGMKKVLDKASLIERDARFFTPVSEINDKGDKAELLEYTKIYTRLVEVFCEKRNISIPEGEDDTFVKECKDIGILECKKDIPLLSDLLGTDFFRFKDAVCFVNTNKELIGRRLDNLYFSVRKSLQAESRKKHNLTLVDFFCGAGGLSLGFVQEGFNIKLANDIEDVCIQTYKYNHPELPASSIIQGDIKQIIDNIEDYINDEIDVVVGGPPCQGFSEANRQRIIDDPRNKLYKYYIEAVKRILPKFVVMENVKGMLKVADQVVEDYGNIKETKDGVTYSYLVGYRVLNSQNFSVAQSRERLIYIAVRNDITESAGITPNDILDRIEDNCKWNPVYTLNDALENIKPLEAPRIKNVNEIDDDITGKKIDFNEFVDDSNEYIGLINQGRTCEYLFNHKARYVNDINYEIYKRLNPGDDATDEKIKDIMPYAHRNHCFKDKYYKLIGDKPCRTITAHLKMDCHSHIHPSQIRALTPREAARVQSFPDDYLFLGAYLKTYMQIGNAVPPMMARGIAKVIKGLIMNEV